MCERAIAFSCPFVVRRASQEATQVVAIECTIMNALLLLLFVLFAVHFILDDVRNKRLIKLLTVRIVKIELFEVSL